MTKSLRNYFSEMHLDVEDLLKFLNIKKIEIRNKNNTISIKDNYKFWISFYFYDSVFFIL